MIDSPTPRHTLTIRVDAEMRQRLARFTALAHYSSLNEAGTALWEQALTEWEEANDLIIPA